MSFTDKFRDFKASKGVLFWSCAGCIVATMVVGFTWGGWTTAGAAEERAQAAAEDAVAQLAADICVNRYLASPDVRTNLAAFNEESVYRRDGLIEDGGWVTLANMEDPIDGAADLCADRLAEVDMSTLPEVPVAEASTISTVPASDVTAVQ
jgi:hypothetical protein